MYVQGRAVSLRCAEQQEKCLDDLQKLWSSLLLPVVLGHVLHKNEIVLEAPQQSQEVRRSLLCPSMPLLSPPSLW